MAQSDMVFVIEIYLFLGLEGNNIIGYDLFRTAKSRQYVGFYESYNHCIIGLSRRNGFYPFGEIVCGSEDPFMLARRGRVYFSNEVQTPLLKGIFSGNWSKG